eukprot:NODE_83_length_22684_cov_0.307934.p5 type:complete len:314 gc:universal NODE_83_length_22684_cov_0.307934:8152-7211(-)
MFDNLKTLTAILVIVSYMTSNEGSSTGQEQRQALRMFNQCTKPKTVSFMTTWGPSSKTGSILNSFQLKKEKATFMVNPNMLNLENKAAVNDAFSKNQIVGMQIPLWPEDIAAMSAQDFANYLKQYADKVSVALNFAGQWPKFIRIPNISKDICLVDLTPMIQIANAMGFVVIQNTKGNGDLQKTEDIAIMTSYMSSGAGYVFSIEDSDTNSIDSNAVNQILDAAAASGYAVVQMSDCVGLGSESTLKSSSLIINIANSIPAGLNASPGFFKMPTVCVDPVTGSSDNSKKTKVDYGSYSNRLETLLSIMLISYI